MQKEHTSQTGGLNRLKAWLKPLRAYSHPWHKKLYSHIKHLKLHVKLASKLQNSKETTVVENETIENANRTDTVWIHKSKYYAEWQHNWRSFKAG